MTKTPLEDPDTFNIIGAAIQVHAVLGGGMLERVYVRAMEIELDARQIPNVREAPIHLRYRGYDVGTYRPDFICYGSVIVEIKASADLTFAHYAQTLHYLVSSTGSRALLINFGRARLQWKRFGRPLQNPKSATDLSQPESDHPLYPIYPGSDPSALS